MIAYDFGIELLQLYVLLIGSAKAEIRHLRVCTVWLKLAIDLGKEAWMTS